MKKIHVLLIWLLIAMLPASALAEGTGTMETSGLIAIGVMVLAMFVGLYFSAKRVKWNASMLAKAAICVALAYILSMIKIFRMPMGGSVSLVSMYPLILFAMAFGPLESLLIGCVYGFMELLLDPYIIHPIQMLVDYPLAYAAVALACLAKRIPVKERFKLPLAVALGYLGKYIMAVISGVVFFAEYAGDQGTLAYSLIYNLSYLGPEALVCMVVAAIPGMSRLPALLRMHSERG